MNYWETNNGQNIMGVIANNLNELVGALKPDEQKVETYCYAESKTEINKEIKSGWRVNNVVLADGYILVVYNK